MSRPKFLVYSTVNHHPFWGGADKFWYEAVLHRRSRDELECYVALRNIALTRIYGDHLRSLGVSVEFYSEPTHTLLEKRGETA